MIEGTHGGIDAKHQKPGPAFIVRLAVATAVSELQCSTQPVPPINTKTNDGFKAAVVDHVHNRPFFFFF